MRILYQWATGEAQLQHREGSNSDSGSEKSFDTIILCPGLIIQLNIYYGHRIVYWVVILRMSYICDISPFLPKLAK